MSITDIEPDPHPAIRVSMMPADTNAHGTIFGGKILSLIDQAGAIGVHRLGVGRVVTVAMREVVFSQPVRVGDIVSCYVENIKGRPDLGYRLGARDGPPSDRHAPQRRGHQGRGRLRRD